MPNALYPHLPSAIPEPVKQREQPRLAQAMWPGPKPPPGWRREDISFIKYSIGQGLSDAEIARRYGVSKSAVEQIRKLAR
jgi:hypothetical protein